MTRKKYERDTVGEQLEKAFESTDSSEEEEETLSDDEIYDIIVHMLEYHDYLTGYNLEWIKKWIDPTDMQHLIMNSKPIIYRPTVPLTRFELNTLRGFIKTIFYECKIQTNNTRVDNVIQGMLSMRDKYEFIYPRSNNHWTRSWARNLIKSEAVVLSTL